MSERRKRRDIERLLNVVQDASGEARFVRELSQSERSKLKYLRKREYRRGAFQLVVLSVVMFVLAAEASLVMNISFGDNEKINWLFAGSMGAAGVFIAGYSTWQKTRSYYLDIRAGAVQLIEGKVHKEFDQSQIVTWYIRGIEFSEREIINFRTMYDKVEEGGFVRVEFSPYSKHVWKITKIREKT